MPHLSSAELFLASLDIFAAQQSGQAVAPLSSRLPGLDLQGAYAIQQMLQHRYESLGHRRIGWKVDMGEPSVGNPSPVCGPRYGFLTDRMWFSHHDVISMSRGSLVRPRLRPAVAIRMRMREGHRTCAQQQPLDVTAGSVDLAPCLELIDSRTPQCPPTTEDAVAENISTALFVLGEAWIPMPSNTDSMPDRGRLLINGHEVTQMPVSQAISASLQAVAWLGTQLDIERVTQCLGEIIVIPTHTASYAVHAGDDVVFAAPGLGRSAATFFV